jgi:DNA mismatch repair protein MutL
MSLIQVLDIQTSNSIAAGEVVERPASVVKELVENALDAGASVIHIEIRQGGIQTIRIADNGSGMDETDARLSFSRHATSKIRSLEDLDQIRTMGFRGEALASIAAVSSVRLETRLIGQDQGTLIEMKAGELLACRPIGCPEGTVIQVDNLFFNTPARFKFLKKDSAEAAAVADLIGRIALARPDVSFRLVSQDNELLHTPGNNDLTSAVFAVFGKTAAQESLPVHSEQPPITVSGLIGTPESARNSRSRQCAYVNGRLVRTRAISAAIDEAYATHLMKHKFPLAVLKLEVPPPLVDVNVHPQKMEVRFWDEQAVFRAVYHAVKNALQAGGAIIEAQLKEQEAPTIPSSNQDHEVLKAADMTLEAIPSTGLSLAEPHRPYLPIEQAAGSQSVQLQDQLNHQESPQPQVSKTINSLVNARLIGQLFSTYLLLEHGQDLLLVDQHAAHERILFEQMVERHRKLGAAAAQPLLVPQPVEVSAHEWALVQDEQQRLAELGFELEAFGQQTILVRSLPAGGRGELRPQAALRILLDALQDDSLENEEAVEAFYYSMACKAATKAHDRLHEDEMNQLLTDLKQLDDPYHCPHGRPVVIRISRTDLEKQFRRIV